MIESLPLSEIGIASVPQPVQPPVQKAVNNIQPIDGDGISNALGIKVETEKAVSAQPETVTPETPPATEVTPAPETTTIETDDFEKEWGDQQKSIFGTPEKATEGAKAVETEKDVDYKKKASEYEAILNDPHVKAIVEARKAGKDIYSLMNDLKGVDVTTLTGEDLIKEDCKRLGITDEDAIASEVDNYNSLTPRQQAQEKLRITSMLEKEQNDRLSQFTSGVQQSQQAFEQQTQKLETELTSLYNARLDKEYFGIKATPEILQSTRAEIDSVLGIFNSDGTYNAKNLFDLAYLKANISSIMRETGKNMYHKGLGKVLADVSRPDKKETSGKPMTVVSGKNPQEKSDEFARMFGGGGKN